MSTCIGQHGEFGSRTHPTNSDYVCELCGVLDEDALIAELQQLRATLNRQKPVIEAAREFVGFIGNVTMSLPIGTMRPLTALAAAVDALSEFQTVSMTPAPTAPANVTNEQLALMTAINAGLVTRRRDGQLVHDRGAHRLSNRFGIVTARVIDLQVAGLVALSRFGPPYLTGLGRIRLRSEGLAP